MQKVREFVETVILTGHIKDCDPVSVALIAEAEHGKTSVALEKNCTSVFVLTDVTGRGIQNLCQMKPEMRHFVINDLMAVGGKKANVVQSTISMLAAMTEEGIRATAYPGAVQTFENGKRGVIVCMTPQMAKDNRHWWNRSGFSSRLLPLCYSHSRAMTIKINMAIRGGSHDAHWSEKVSKELKVPVSLTVKIPPKYADRIMRIAEIRATSLKETGYRRHHQYRGMARAHAIWRSWKNRVVAETDIDFLEWMDDFVSYTDAKPL